jgi:hypothetical protein
MMPRPASKLLRGPCTRPIRIFMARTALLSLRLLSTFVVLLARFARWVAPELFQDATPNDSRNSGAHHHQPPHRDDTSG